MKIIAHRGITDGPYKEKENKLFQIYNAIWEGFDVEVDVWCIDGDLYFGHDAPEYRVPEKTIVDIAEQAWFHCKNFEAVNYFTDTELNYFWHQNDDFTLTSDGHIWTTPGKNLGPKSIFVLPEVLDPESRDKLIALNPYGICTDYPKLFSLY